MCEPNTKVDLPSSICPKAIFSPANSPWTSTIIKSTFFFSLIFLIIEEVFLKTYLSGRGLLDNNLLFQEL